MENTHFISSRLSWNENGKRWPPKRILFFPLVQKSFGKMKIVQNSLRRSNLGRGKMGEEEEEEEEEEESIFSRSLGGWVWMEGRRR